VRGVERPIVIGVSPPRRFEVVLWPTDRRLTVYVPEIEAATTVIARADADAAARSLIADLTGLDAAQIRCDVRYGRAGPSGVA